MSDAVTLAGAQPTKLVTSWMMDRIAPAYWIPNSKLTVPFLHVFIFYLLCNVLAQHPSLIIL